MSVEWIISRPPYFYWLAALGAVLFYHLIWWNRIRVWPLQPKYIPNESLVTLSNYKYKSGMSSWLDIHIMNPIWSWSADHLVPDWLAPNLITTLSLSHGVVTCALLLYYAPSLKGVAPSWVYLLGTWNMWMYQLLDAIDGKQARRMEASSPLGQLFDHGCDAICCFLTGFMVCCILQTGPEWCTIVIFLMCVVPFFISNWEEVQTGTMRFGVIGVTEAQLLVMALLFSSGLVGPQFWQRTITIPMGLASLGLSESYPVYYGLVVFGVVSVSFALYDSFRVVNAFNRANGIDSSAGHWQVGQFVGCLVFGCVWCYLTADTVFGSQPVLPLFSIGICFAYLVSRLIIHKTAHAPFARVHEILFPLPLIVLNSACRKYGFRFRLLFGICSDCECFPFDEYAVAWCYLAFVSIVYSHFVSSAIREICAFLKIRIFHLPSAEERIRKRKEREAAAAALAAAANAKALENAPPGSTVTTTTTTTTVTTTTAASTVKSH